MKSSTSLTRETPSQNLQEKARLQSQEDEAIKSMSRQEQAEAEKKYQQEVGKNVELTDKLRDAVKDQVSFNC